MGGEAVKAAIRDVGLRWSTVQALWPEVPTGKGWEQAVPVDVVIRALGVELERAREVAARERRRADEAQRRHGDLIAAATAVFELAPSSLFPEVA